MEDDLLYHFNKILLEKRDEIIEIANNKKKEKKMNDINGLTKDIRTTASRINLENEKRIKNSARYKKKEDT